jgi:hypothetical protein
LHCGTLIEFRDAEGKVLDALLVGKRHLRPQSPSDPFRLRGLFDGCYVRLPADPENVLLISDELAAVAPEPQTWLSRDFLKIENIKSISLVSTNGANVWTLLREAEARPWSLSDVKSADGEILDTAAAGQIAEMLPFLTFIDVMNAAAPGTAALDKPMVAFIETFDHFFYTLKIGSGPRPGIYALKVSVTTDRLTDQEDKSKREKLAKEQLLAPWLYLVESTAIEPLLRDRSQLLQKKTVVSR